MSNIVTLTGLQPGTVYSATVTATNVIGESVPSDPLTIYTGMVPSKITSLVWESSTTTSITFRWILPESNGGLSLQKFKLYVDVGQTGQPTTEIEISDVFSRTHTLDNLSTGTLVDIQISSLNASGESVKSDVLTLQVAAKPEAPDAPTETAITQDSYGSQMISI